MKIYLSHAIMGVKGTNALEEYIQENLQKAINLAVMLRAVYPDVQFYVPAEHEDFVNRTYKKGYLTIDQILDIDCDIIATCDAVLFYNHEGVLSNGMKKELKFTQENCISYVIVNGDTDLATTIRSCNELLRENK